MDKREAKTYKPREQQYDLFRSQALIVGIICLGGGIHAKNRNISFAANGMNSILSELRYQYEYCAVEKIKEYNFALLSLTSISDVESAALQITEQCKGKCKIIAGGQGCISIRPIINIIDVAVFGRAEGQINDIIDGATPRNVWRKETDPLFLRQYEVRQFQYFLSGERSVGCKKKCFFCQYTWSRKYVSTGATYSHGSDLVTPEEDWSGLQVSKPGRYTTAWDGWSESTRFKVNKCISDAQISDKLSKILAENFSAAVNIKIFNIVWYPWETEETLRSDIANVAKILRAADAEHGTRILIMFLLTPFSPEPLTPMAHMPANVTEDTRGIVERIGRQVYKGKKIEAFILPQINSGYTLAKRVLINRGGSAAMLRALADATKKYKATEKMVVAAGELDMSIFREYDGECNLLTYCQIPNIRTRVLREERSGVHCGKRENFVQQPYGAIPLDAAEKFIGGTAPY